MTYDYREAGVLAGRYYYDARNLAAHDSAADPTAINSACAILACTHHFSAHGALLPLISRSMRSRTTST